MSPYEETFNGYFDARRREMACLACCSLHEVGAGARSPKLIAKEVCDGVKAGYLIICMAANLDYNGAAKWFEAFKRGYLTDRLQEAIEKYRSNPQNA